MIKETLGIGRRKTAVSSVRLRKGNGIVDVNGRTLNEYFPLQLQRDTILAPLKKFSDPEKFDMIIEQAVFVDPKSDITDRVMKVLGGK